MEIGKVDERFYTVKIMRSLPLVEQIHQANALICTEAAEDENVFLEKMHSQNGHILLEYRLLRKVKRPQETRTGE